MAYNDKNMVNDYSGHKIPQYYNPVTDKYEPLHGADGVSFVGNHVLSDSGIWLPVSATNPMHVKNNELENKIDNLEAKIDSVIENGSINTRVTGSIVENTQIRKSQVLVQRGIYNTNQNFFQLDVPNGARGVILQLGVGGVTGTFASGEGIRLEAGFTKRPAPSGHYIGVQTDVKSVFGTHAVFWYPGAFAQDIKATTNNSSLSTIGLPLPDVIRARTVITGTFQTDEGFDIEFVADWIY